MHNSQYNTEADKRQQVVPFLSVKVSAAKRCIVNGDLQITGVKRQSNRYAVDNAANKKNEQ